MKRGNTMNNQTTKATTKEKLTALFNERNRIIKWLDYNKNELSQSKDFEQVNFEIMQTISEIATYKTLVFLQTNNATKNTATENTETDRNEHGTTNTYGYDMSVKLLKTLYTDLAIFRNPNNLTDIFTDTADLIQESNAILTPYFIAPIPLNIDDVLYTKVLKNGNVRNYTAFQLSCKAIRKYITEQQQKQFKKISYVVGIADNGEQVTTTKRPKNDISGITATQRKYFIMSYNLTAIEQTAILNKLNGLSTTEQAEKMQVSKRTIERALKSAKEKISKADHRIKL